MSWQQIFLACFFGANAIFTVGMIGRDRQKVDPPTAAISLIIYAGLIAVALTA